MSDLEKIVRDYTAAFASCDVERIVGYMHEDVVWEMNGETVVTGRAAFAGRMREDLGAGSAEVTVERLVEQDGVVAVANRGRFVPHGGGESFPFVSAEFHEFAGTEIVRIRTYQSMS